MITCPVCGNNIPSTYCAICESNLIEINGDWYSEVLYNAATEITKTLNITRQIKKSIIEQTEKASLPTFISFNNHPNYYVEIENVLIESINSMNNFDIMRESMVKILYDEYYVHAIKTIDPLFGDTEEMMVEIFNNLDNIFDNLKYLLSRVFEILRNDSTAQRLFLKYDIHNVLEDEERKIIRRKELEKKRIRTTPKQEVPHEFNESKEEKISMNKHRIIDI